MNKRIFTLHRGLFRLWLIASACFVIATAIINYDGIKGDFDSAALDEAIKNDILLVPVPCGQARGVAGTDYDRSTKDPTFCWYELPVFRKLYTEYKDLSDDVLGERLYRAAGLVTLHPLPWAHLKIAIAIALGIPVVTLMLGVALLWAAAGFFRREQKPDA